MSNYRLTVEVPIFLSAFAGMLTGSVYSNLIIYRTCYTILGYNESDCALLGNTNNNITQHLEKLVEPQVAVINMVGSIVGATFTTLLSMFFGSWSDKFGRKPILLLGEIGAATHMLLVTLFSYFPNISPWYTLSFALVTVFTGGMAVHLTVIYAYVTDITNEENRGFRMAIIEAVSATASLLGNISSSYIFYATSYVAVFAIAAACSALSATYVLFFVPESLASRQTEGKLTGFFRLSHIVEMAKVTVRRRPNYDRAIILLCLSIGILCVMPVMGGSLKFLYLREKLNWTLMKYTWYSSITSLMGILCTIGGTYLLHNTLHIRESLLILVGMLASTSSEVLNGLASSDWYIYAAAVVRCVDSVSGPMMRTLMSKLVPAEEMGKMFSFIMAIAIVMAIAGSLLYTAVYNATINTVPGAFNFMSAGFIAFSVVLIIVVIYLEKRKPVNSYSAMNSDETTNEEDETTNEEDEPDAK